MTCLNCGSPDTIRAHLIPRVFARQVQQGKSHAANVRPDGRFVATQSGLFDKHILCHTCDARIGVLEEYAARATDAIRHLAVNETRPIVTLPGFSGQTLLRFAAALLWKYSVAEHRLGRLFLGPYQTIAQEVGLREAIVPASFDAALIRLRIDKADDRVFAYRAPKPDRRNGINLVRLLVGGVLFLIKLDKRAPDPALSRLWLRNADRLSFGIAPAHHFEEFQQAVGLTSVESKLAQFLDDQA